jgi:hypothetical protein
MSLRKGAATLRSDFAFAFNDTRQLSRFFNSWGPIVQICNASDRSPDYGGAGAVKRENRILTIPSGVETARVWGAFRVVRSGEYRIDFRLVALRLGAISSTAIDKAVERPSGAF